jgi:hypothetical protein
LVVGEAQRDEAGGRVGLVAAPVSGLLRGGSVVAETVGFNDEAEIRPVEVDVIAVDPLLGERSGQSGLAHDRKKEALELGGGKLEIVAEEGPAEDADAAPGRLRLKCSEEGGWGNPVEAVRFVDGVLELPRRENGGEVDEGEYGTRGRDASVGGDVSRIEAATVRPDRG